MRAYVGDFTLSRLERVLSGPGAIASLGAELDRRSRSRALIITGRTLGASPLVQRIADTLGPRCAGVFAGARQHVPASTIASLVAEIVRLDADCLVSFGGGSPIDTTKIALNAVIEREIGRDVPTPPVHVAVPTTLSASEFTSVAGVTDDETRIKRPVLDPRTTAQVVVADPEVTSLTPDWLWAASGVRALDHAVECMYAAKHHPYSDALGIRAIALLRAHLPPSIRTHGDVQLDHRGQCLTASWLSVVGLTHVGFGVSHALGHQLGPRWDIPHGLTSCVTLPHAMRLMGELAPERFELIAQGFDVPFMPGREREAAMACADRMAALVAELGLPSRLRDLEVPRDALESIADTVHAGIERARVVEKAVAQADVRALLEAAY